ncbi:hypothetical protein RDABS01_014749 [Bienertia sinuspersici]
MPPSRWMAQARLLRHFLAIHGCYVCQSKKTILQGGCRPIIGIVGEHLSGFYKGYLLTAVVIDDYNEIFPIAQGVVDVESLKNRGYVFRNLRLLFHQNGVEKDEWCFINDGMKVITTLCMNNFRVEASLHEVFPKETRRICCQHLYSNCKKVKESGTTFHDLFWVAANAYSHYVYNKAIDKIIKLDPTAFDYLEKVTEQWSKHTFN